ncbi:MAG: TrkH family potassium uptake protein, partial [Clostridia bacterium]|nr:TrkH family potassium uptake protein [Clostridia bacterium]
VEGLSQGMLFWRSFTHWIGGMGVLVFIMAFMSNVSDRPIHIMRAEMPGPVIGKIMPRAKDTAKVLYIIYVVITALEIIMLLFGGMSLFESAVLSFGTAGTGGFGIRGDSIGGYSPYVQWVITVFMLIFGVNFNLYFLILIKKFSTAIKSTEFWTYITMVLVSTGIISVSIYPMYKNVGEVIRLSVFQSASIITTTGYSTADFNTWPALVKALLFVLLFSGACAGSTAGGFKISRIIILIKAISKEIRRMLHTHSVQTVKFEGKAVEDTTLYGIMIYLAIYFACIFVVFLLISLEPFGIETNLSAAISCFNNVGPGFGSVGPAYSYAGYSAFSKLVLSAAMLFGRLEIFPVLVLFSPAAWKKN